MPAPKPFRYVGTCIARRAYRQRNGIRPSNK